MAESALTIWKRKLEFLLQEEAVAAGPEQKFELQEKIAEARAKIRELDDGAGDVKPEPPHPLPNLTPRTKRTGSPFIVGQPIERDEDLFGRHDQRDLLQDAVLTGQSVQVLGERRMGKTSLLKWVARHASAWQERPVVWLNAQGLAGQSPRALVHAVAEGLGRRGEAEKALADDNAAAVMGSLLPVWATADLLDLVRASGDVLERIRFLLATAYPLPRLGPHWVDRLINVLPRQLGPLAPAEAESLIREPMPGFPDIYPEGGVEKIVGVTRGHPYLVQLVCDHLCRHLNKNRRLVATSEDVQAAIDQALIETPLFDELWRQRTADERRVLKRLASGGEVAEDDGAVVKGLEREGYVLRGEGVAVPMFASWIVENT